MQATDSRFVNASVEFDLASLRPTYRLIWGEGGQSNALAVAEGLGFDPNLIQRACQIATHRQVCLLLYTASTVRKSVCTACVDLLHRVRFATCACCLDPKP